MKQKCIVIILIFFVFSKTQSTSLVYSFRFTQITRPVYVAPQTTEQKVGAASIFERYSKTAQGSKDNILAAFLTFIYQKKLNYIRLDWAYGNVRNNLVNGTCLNENQSDDLLVTFGKAWNLNTNFTISLSGVTGFPTHRDKGLVFTQLGTGHVGLGAQLDGAYNYSANKYHSILFAGRYIRFLSAHANIETDNCKILQRFRLKLGNLIDLYASHYSDWGKHKFEIAYNPTFYFGAQFCPPNEQLECAFHFVRSSIIAAYSYAFLLNKHPSSIILAFSYGSDHGKRPTRSTAVVYGVAAFAYSF